MTLSLDFGKYLTQGGGIVASQFALRAQIKWSRILDKQTAVTFTRRGQEVAEQIVAIEWEDTFSDTESDMGIAYTRKGTLHGVKGHPTIDDLDVMPMDVFVFNGMEYTIATVNMNLIGEIQADFEAVG